MAAHHQRPGVVQALQRIRSRAPSHSAAREAFSAASASNSSFRIQRFWYACEVSEPAEWLVSSISPRVARKPGCFGGRDIEEHLVAHSPRSRGPGHPPPLQMATPDGPALQEDVYPAAGGSRCLGDDRFKTFNGFLIWSPADVASAVIMIVGETPLTLPFCSTRAAQSVCWRSMNPILLDLRKASLLSAQIVILLDPCGSAADRHSAQLA